MVRVLFTNRPPTRGRLCAIVWRLPYRFPGFWCCCSRRFCRSRVSAAELMQAFPSRISEEQMEALFNACEEWEKVQEML